MPDELRRGGCEAPHGHGASRRRRPGAGACDSEPECPGPARAGCPGWGPGSMGPGDGGYVGASGKQPGPAARAGASRLSPGIIMRARGLLVPHRRNPGPSDPAGDRESTTGRDGQPAAGRRQTRTAVVTARSGVPWHWRPVVNLREFLPDEAIHPIKMGDGEAPVVPEFKHLGSMLSKNFDDSVTIMARFRLARIAFTKLSAKGYFREEARCALV